MAWEGLRWFAGSFGGRCGMGRARWGRNTLNSAFESASSIVLVSVLSNCRCCKSYLVGDRE